MDVKSVIRSLVPFANTAADSARRREKAETLSHSTAQSTSDRDANGQSQKDGGEKRRNLSQEELEQAMKALEDVPGVKDSGLRLELTSKDGTSVVTIKDSTGKVVRRIPESELSTLLEQKAKKTGNLLNRAM